MIFWKNFKLIGFNPMQIKNPEKVVRIAVITTLSFMVCWGLVSVVAEVRPFWVDEWRIMYNLKFKSATELWGPLDFMQQFPRVYMQIVKVISGAFNYNYFGLRITSYIIGSFTIVFCYRLMNKIFSPTHFNRFLFVMILISCSTFTLYYVQIKQYTMDMLLSVIAVWQLWELINLDVKNLRIRRYLLLCLSLLIVPFFSYIYPVAIAPVFIVALVQSIYILKDTNILDKTGILVIKWLPLCLCAISIGVFYIVDVSQLLQDQGMRRWWGPLLLDQGFNWGFFLYSIYNLFAEIGSGLVYWIIFGTLGTIAFFYGIYNSARNLYGNKNSPLGWLRLYSVLLLVFVFMLFLLKKLPVGEPRLNAFTIPAISILIIYFLDELKHKRAGNKISWGISFVLSLGLIGNIYTTFIAAITDPKYAKEMDIYRSTQKAILLAQTNKIPIFITPGVAYPYDSTVNLPFKNTVPGDWVLKSFPAYCPANRISVYPINDLKDLKKLENIIDHLPDNITEVLVGDGIAYHIIKR